MSYLMQSGYSGTRNTVLFGKKVALIAATGSAGHFFEKWSFSSVAVTGHIFGRTPILTVFVKKMSGLIILKGIGVH